MTILDPRSFSFVTLAQPEDSTPNFELRTVRYDAFYRSFFMFKNETVFDGKN